MPGCPVLWQKSLACPQAVPPALLSSSSYCQHGQRVGGRNGGEERDMGSQLLYSQSHLKLSYLISIKIKFSEI